MKFAREKGPWFDRLDKAKKKRFDRNRRKDHKDSHLGKMVIG